jgi:hypothetical protein
MISLKMPKKNQLKNNLKKFPGARTLNFGVPLKDPLLFASFALPTTPISPPSLSTPIIKIMAQPGPMDTNKTSGAKEIGINKPTKFNGD